MDERERMAVVKLLVKVAKATIAASGQQAGVVVLVFNGQGETTLGSSLEDMENVAWLLDNAAEVTSRYCHLALENNNGEN